MKKRFYFLPEKHRGSTFCFLLFAICLLPFESKTQTSDLPIGSWHIFQPYQRGNDVTQSDNYVYWSTGLSILRYNKQDQTTERWDKLNHLTQAGISRVAFDKTNNTLIVFYDDNAIDLVNTNGVRTLSDIKNNNAIVGDKSIYDIYSTPTITYLACGFGLVGLDVARGEFQFTTFTNQKINSVTVLQNVIYMAGGSGIYTISTNTNSNIADFGNWRKLGSIDGFAASYSSTILRSFNNLLYFNYNDSLCYLSSTKKIIALPIDRTLKLNYLTTEGKNLIAGFILDCPQYGISGTCSLGFSIDAANKSKNLPNNCYSFNTRAIEDAAGNIWFANAYPTDFRSLGNNATNCNTTQINSTSLSSAGSIALTDSTAWIVSQGLSGLVARGEGEGFSMYQPNQTSAWSNFNIQNQPKLNTTQAGIDNYDVSINKVTNKVYVSSFQHGLIELQNGVITKIYDNTNSPIQPANGDVGRQRVTGLLADNDGNEWVINANTTNAILVLKPDNTWLKMQNVAPQNVLTHIISDSANYKWIINASNGSGGIWIYDTTQYTLNNVSNHRTKYIDNSALPSEVQNGILNTLCTDLDGRVWAGTDKGVCVFDCGNDPIASNCKARLVVSTLGGISEYLLLNKAVNVIAVDGGNRKWFGTTTGLIVTSADGKTQIYNFNTDNSPLVSNNITSLAIRNKTGEVFIGTDKGLMVYRANATTGRTYNSIDSAYAFPNPVKADYDGPIAIKNLARDAAVKITDVNGNLIYETRANGGEAIWNARDFNNRHVQSGVYLAWVANVRNIDAGDGIVVKILVIR